MRRLVEKYAPVPAHRLDYTELLRATNAFGAGRDLEFDEEACRRLATLIAEAEARVDLEAAAARLSGRSVDAARMKVSCELEFWAFFEPNAFRRVLYIGSGAYPQIALYALARLPELTIDAVDVIPHCTVLCAQVAERLGLSDRLRPFTLAAQALPAALVAGYDGFFISSAVRPKNRIIERLLAQKRGSARIYAREDQAHPHFYEPVTVTHRDVLTAREARSRWRAVNGSPAPLPPGCEVPEPEHSAPS